MTLIKVRHRLHDYLEFIRDDPRQQAVYVVNVLCARQLFKDTLKVIIRIQVVGLGRLNQAIEIRARMSTRLAAGEQPIFSPYDKRTN